MNMSYKARKSKMRMIFSMNHVLFFLLLSFFSLFVCLFVGDEGRG